MRLIFVRHGEPDYKNDCLTPNGVEQAKCTAERLRNKPIAAVYSSPLGRARETASYTAGVHGLDVNILDFMREINWGTIRKDENDDRKELEFGGHPWTLSYQLLTEHPEYVGNYEWDKHELFSNNICTGYYDIISTEFDKFLLNFGLERKDGLYCCNKVCNDTIALFAHGGSGAIMFSHVLNIPLPYVFCGMPYAVCSVSSIVFDAHEGKKVIPRLELFNDVGHIPNLKTERLKFDK